MDQPLNPQRITLNVVFRNNRTREVQVEVPDLTAATIRRVGDNIGTYGIDGIPGLPRSVKFGKDHIFRAGLDS